MFRRFASALAVTALVAGGVSAGPAAAQVVAPPAPTVLPVAPPGLLGLTAAQWATPVAGTGVVAPVAIAASGFAIGYGIGTGLYWGGSKAVGFIGDKFFASHNPAAATPTSGTAVAGFGRMVCGVLVRANDPNCKAAWMPSNFVFLGVPPQTYYMDYDSRNPSTGAISSVRNSKQTYCWNPGYGQDPCVVNLSVGGRDLLGVRIKRQPGGAQMMAFGTLLEPNPYKLQVTVGCQYGDGHTAVFKAETAAFGSPSNAPSEYPAVTCPTGSHAVSMDGCVYDSNKLSCYAPDFTATTPQRFRDPNDPYASCLALSGGTPCTWAATAPNGSPWTPEPDPDTGVIPGPQTCTWGGFPRPVDECVPVGPDTNGGGGGKTLVDADIFTQKLTAKYGSVAAACERAGVIAKSEPGFLGTASDTYIVCDGSGVPGLVAWLEHTTDQLQTARNILTIMARGVAEPPPADPLCDTYTSGVCLDEGEPDLEPAPAGTGAIVPPTNCLDRFPGARQLLLDSMINKGYVQDHHVASNKNSSRWTAQFESITSNYGLSLNDSWNMILQMPHVGSHVAEYHEWVFENMDRIDAVAAGDAATFRALFTEWVIDVVRADPTIVRLAYWKCYR